MAHPNGAPAAMRIAAARGLTGRCRRSTNTLVARSRSIASRTPSTGRCLADPLLKPLFGEGQPEHVDHLTAFTCESFGGPDRFSRELGFRHLIDVHRGLEISERQRVRFVELYMEALDESDMPADEDFRARSAHTSTSAPGSRCRTRARRPRRSCIPCARCRAGPGQAMLLAERLNDDQRGTVAVDGGRRRNLLRRGEPLGGISGTRNRFVGRDEGWFPAELHGGRRSAGKVRGQHHDQLPRHRRALSALPVRGVPLRCNISQARASRRAVPAPASAGATSSSGTPPTCAITSPPPSSRAARRRRPTGPPRRRSPSRTRRGGSTTRTAGTAGSPPASPPSPPGGRAR